MTGPQKNGAPQSSLGTINVILATLRRESHLVSRVMLVSPQMAGSEEEAPCKKARVSEQPIIGFTEEDKLVMIQPHDDALMVTLQIARFDVKRVMVDQGSEAEIMYPDWFKGLGFKLEDLDQYDVPLIGFDGNTTISKGII